MNSPTYGCRTSSISCRTGHETRAAEPVTKGTCKSSRATRGLGVKTDVGCGKSLFLFLHAFRFHLLRGLVFGDFVQFRGDLLFRLVNQFLAGVEEIFGTISKFPSCPPSVFVSFFDPFREKYASSFTGFRGEGDADNRADR